MLKIQASLVFLLVMLKMGNAAICGNGTSYIEKSQMCCNNKVVARKNGLFCCRNTLIDATLNSYFVNFADLKCCDWIFIGNFDCCGGLQYNTNLYACCNNALYAKGKQENLIL